MDLIFNRKVVKPIRGGAAATPSRENRNSSGMRENSRGRTNLSKALSFGEFMQNQKTSQRIGRQSLGALRSPARAPPLVKPEQ